MSFRKVAVAAIALFLNACAHRPAVVGDIEGLRKIPLAMLEKCQLCMGGTRTSALGCAAAAGQYEAAKALLEMGAKATNCRGGVAKGETSPLNLAAKTGNARMVKLLLDHGADPSYHDGKACPLHFAEDNGPIVEMLLRAGANVDCRNLLTEMTPVEEARKYGRFNALRLLEGGAPPAAPVATAAQAPAAPPTAAPPVERPRFRLPERPDDFALVVGVETYAVGLPRASYAERDAEAVRDHLVALGWPERNIKTLTGARATKGQLEAYLEDWLPRMAKGKGRVFFYFSGHGSPDVATGQGYLVPHDGDPAFLARTAYPLKRLYSKLGELRSENVIVALDSCFSGAGGRSVIPSGARPLVVAVELPSEKPAGMLVFTAASANEITGSLDSEGHGAFTYHFLKGLAGGAKDASGAVTASSLHGYLKPRVQDAAARQNRDQTPQFRGNPDEVVAVLR